MTMFTKYSTDFSCFNEFYFLSSLRRGHLGSVIVFGHEKRLAGVTVLHAPSACERQPRA